MENKIKEGREGGIQPDLRAKLLLALIIIGVVALGLLAVNQFLAFRFKAQFLNAPCDLCLELNPHLEGCFNSDNIETNNNKINYSFPS